MRNDYGALAAEVEVGGDPALPSSEKPTSQPTEAVLKADDDNEETTTIEDSAANDPTSAQKVGARTETTTDQTIGPTGESGGLSTERGEETEVGRTQSPTVLQESTSNGNEGEEREDGGEATSEDGGGDGGEGSDRGGDGETEASMERAATTEEARVVEENEGVPDAAVDETADRARAVNDDAAAADSEAVVAEEAVAEAVEDVAGGRHRRINGVDRVGGR